MTEPGEAGTANGRSSVEISSGRSSVKKGGGTVAEGADVLSQASGGSTLEKDDGTVAAANILSHASGRSSVKKGDGTVAEASHGPFQIISDDDAASGCPNQVNHLADIGADRGCGDILLQAILSWSLEDVINEDFYKSKIKRLPQQFKSVDHYTEVQFNSLVEEVRARVHRSINQIQLSELSYEILSVSDVDSSVLLYFDIDVVKLSHNGFNHSPKDGDIYLLTVQPPQNIQLDNLCLLGVAMDIGADNSSQKSFRMAISAQHEKGVVKTTKFASFITNIAEKLIISKSISLLDSSTIKLIIQKNESFSTCCAEISESKQLPNKFNEDQLDCIRSILPKLECEHEPSVHLIWGSCGTGKTLLTCTFMHLLIKSRKQILVCAPRESSIIRLLRQLRKNFPEVKSSHMIVLNDMDTTSTSTSLSNKFHMLYCAVFLWKSFTKEMAWVLGLDSYLPKAQTDGTKKQSVVQFSFDSYKRKFLSLLQEVKVCSKKFISSLGDIYLRDIEVDKVKNMLGTLSKFEELLQNEAINASDVEKAFGLPETLPSPLNKIVSGTAKDLNKTRIHCLDLIKDLISVVKIPELRDRNDLERFCIAHSKIIIGTPNSFSRLHAFGIKPEILIVDDAAQITESDLLTPLSLTAPIKHILFLGDHLHFHPMLESEVRKKAGHGISMFERLISLNFDKKIIREQYCLPPLLSQIHSKLFYEGRILDGSNVKSDGYNKTFKELGFSPYQFIDISNVAELRTKGGNVAELSVIMYLLERLCNGLANSAKVTKVGIVCLCYKQANSVKDLLSLHYEERRNISVVVISIDNLYDRYDIVILSLVSVDLPEGNRLNLVLTSARHSLWIIGEGSVALTSLLACNEQPTMHSETLSKVMQQLETNNLTLQKKSMQKAGQEFTWKGRPYRTKNILPDVRDQKDDPDTCSLQTVLGVFESVKKVQYACLDPPQDFNWNLSFLDLKSKYESSVGEEFLKTKNKERGKRRLETEMEVLKQYGIKGVMSNEEVIFKIKSYERLKMTEKKGIDFSDIKKHLRSACMMACYFRVSSNFFYLKPGDCYEYDEENPYIHPKSELPVSHAVMGIGFGMLPSPVLEGKTQATVIFQNSAGPVFGFDGIGKVEKQSVRGAYVLNAEDLGRDTNTEST